MQVREAQASSILCHRELQHFVGLSKWRASERRIKFATGAAPNTGADHLHHLLQHRHQVLLEVLAGRRETEHLQPDMEAMFDIA